MLGSKSPLLSGIVISSVTLASIPLHGGQLSPSSEIQQNIAVLLETKNCPRCDLQGAVLNRMDLSGANLQGANLSRAKMFLTDLSGANLKNSNLSEAVFSGADLGEADLRGAVMTGASLAGAYLGGTLLDGEMVTTTPYAQDKITDAEETVYVDDTVKPKILPETEEISIATRREFEETAPATPLSDSSLNASEQEITPPSDTAQSDLAKEEIVESVPGQSTAAPDAKVVTPIKEVRIEVEADDSVLPVADSVTKKSTEQGAAITLESAELEAAEGSQAVVEKPAAEKPLADDMTPGLIASAIVAGEEPSVDDTGIADEQALPEAPVDPEEKVEAVESAAESDQPVLVQEPPVEPSVAEPGVIPDDPGLETVSDATEGVAATEKKEEAEQVPDPAAGGEVPVENEEVTPEVIQNIEILLDTNRCYGCNLAGADLNGENLDEADLEGADLSNALLRKADLEEANLKGANLSGADLSGADLSGADLYRALLINADLTDAELEGSLLDDADLSGVKGYQQNIMLMESKEQD